jgi:hypothetical protein
MWYKQYMKTAFEVAVRKAKELPAETREQIGRDVLLRIEKLERLRADLQIGIDQLDAGQGSAIDITDIIIRAHRQHGPKT